MELTFRQWLVLVAVGMSLVAPLCADTIKMEAPPKVSESTHATDKAAVQEAASESDQWAAKNVKKDSPSMAEEAAKETPKASAVAVPPTPATPVTAAKPAEPVSVPVPDSKPAALPTGLNEMRGKFESKSYDPLSLRLSVDGGYHVGFTYDAKTTLRGSGQKVAIEDLNYGDEIVIHYAGKELYAIDIERVGLAPRPQ